MISDTPYAYRIVGCCRNDRRLVDGTLAFGAYAACDERAQVDRESFLSAFFFGEDFRQLLESTGRTKGFVGETWSPVLWFDIDADELSIATDHARRLATALADRYDIDGNDLLLFFSGSKGFHIGVPTSLWNPKPAVDYHARSRRLAELLANEANVNIDTSVYDRVRAFRAPNSRHSKTGLHKRHLKFDELTTLTVEQIMALAAAASPFDLPSSPPLNQQAVKDWDNSVIEKPPINQKPKIFLPRNPRNYLNRATLDFILKGAAKGERKCRLFSAAANLGEFQCTYRLAYALLSDIALDCGLPPMVVERQIRCGLERGGNSNDC